jgi:hypothetical protein
MDTKPVAIKSATLLGARAVRLIVDPLRSGGEGYVYELHAEGVKSAEGKQLVHREAYYTLQIVPAEAPAIKDTSRAAR